MAQQPRLILFCLLFAACSPQLLLYFRQSRYYAFMAGALIAAFYLYERWWRSGKTVYLGALTLVALLAFCNHYNGGAATMLALAAWHLIHRSRATTLRQWLALAAGGIVVVALGTAYLAWVGVIGGERSGFLAFTGVTAIAEVRGVGSVLSAAHPAAYRSLHPRPCSPRTGSRGRCSSGSRGCCCCRSRAVAAAPRRPARRGEEAPEDGKGPARPAPPELGAERSPREAPGAELPVNAAAGIVLMGALFALFSAALSGAAGVDAESPLRPTCATIWGHYHCFWP